MLHICNIVMFSFAFVFAERMEHVSTIGSYFVLMTVDNSSGFAVGVCQYCGNAQACGTER